MQKEAGFYPFGKIEVRVRVTLCNATACPLILFTSPVFKPDCTSVIVFDVEA